MRIAQVIMALTNNVGEKPYYRRVNGDVKVFVADDQEFCTIAHIEDHEGYDEEIAEAICEAGLMLKRLLENNENAQGVLSGRLGTF